MGGKQREVETGPAIDEKHSAKCRDFVRELLAAPSMPIQRTTLRFEISCFRAPCTCFGRELHS